MVRTQVQLTEGQVQRLRTLAAREGVSIARLVRQAVDALVRSQTAASTEERRRRAMNAAGRFASGRSDASRRHDDDLAEAFRR